MTKRTLGPFKFGQPRGRSKDQRMGRFGGGWQYVLGFQAGTFTRKDGGTVILNYLVDSIRIEYRPKGSRYRDW